MFRQKLLCTKELAVTTSLPLLMCKKLPVERSPKALPMFQDSTGYFRYSESSAEDKTMQTSRRVYMPAHTVEGPRSHPTKESRAVAPK